MTRVIRPSTGLPERQWLAGFVPKPNARVRLFCFPYAGGAAQEFRSWSEALGEDVEVYPVQLPGRENRLSEPAFDELPRLLEGILDAFSARWSDPFVLFGHSMGALVAFELARELRRRVGTTPAHLFLSGRCAPRHRDPARVLHSLPEADFIERLRDLDGTPEEVFANAELREVFFPTLRADFAVCERYRYRAETPLECPITVFGGSRDEEHPPALLEEWQAETSGAFALHMFPGNHFFIRTARQAVLATLGRELVASMDKVRTSPPGRRVDDA
jgi:medium-chain acyl-[acyl-carrier-protein] hydrolase